MVTSTTKVVSSTSKVASSTVVVMPTPEPEPQPEPEPEPAPVGTLQKWSQCGGIGWTGSGSCVEGTECVASGDYYSQCL